MKIKSISIFLMAAAVLSACSSGETPSGALKARLEVAASSGDILFGHQDALMYGHSWRAVPGDDLDRSDVKDVCGSHPAVLGFDLGGIETGSPANLDGCPFDLMRKAASLHYERGGIVTFSWHLCNPLTGGDSWDVSSKEVVASVLEGGREHGTMLEWLSACADFLSSIRDSNGNIIPVIFRPWHEHTGSWFWWGQDLCTPEQYVALWNMTYSYLVKERGLTNLVWAYSPGAGVDMKGYMERYPGDKTVDVLGLDCYQTFQPEVYNISLMKELYGDRLSFWGGISTQQCLPYATPEGVKEEAVRIAKILHKDGGFIIAPTHAIEFDVPPENIMSLLEVFQNQEKYFKF